MSETIFMSEFSVHCSNLSYIIPSPYMTGSMLLTRNEIIASHKPDYFQGQVTSSKLVLQYFQSERIQVSLGKSNAVH